jgi:hypothetical protein
MLLYNSNQGELGGRDMWNAWEEEKSVQGFGGKSRRNEVTRCRWENGIRMDLRVIDWRDVEWIQLAQGFCKYGNELTGSVATEVDTSFPGVNIVRPKRKYGVQGLNSEPDFLSPCYAF